MIDVIVTGSNGFVGKNFIKYAQDYRLNIYRLRLRNKEDVPNLRDAECIVHLGGKAHDFSNSTDLNKYYEINYMLTKHLYNKFLDSNVKKFIFLSSVKAVTDQTNLDLIEDFHTNPNSNYGKSKLMAEKFIVKQSLPEFKSYYILRPCMIHGPGNKGNLNLLYQFAKHGLPYPLASFENKRSFVSIENLCFIINELIERNDIPSGIYNVADDIPLSTNRIIEIMSETINKKPKLWKIDKQLIKLIARIGDYLPIPLNSERLQKLTENYVVSNAKLKQAIGKELPIASEEGFIKTIESFNKHR